MNLEPGTHVRIVRPDRDAHRRGIVTEPQGPTWPVWVDHWCDCWEAGSFYAYSIAPVLYIETADGERHTWRADMCEEVAR